MTNIDRVLLVTLLGMGAVSVTTLYSLNSRIEALEGRLATPEVTSALAGPQGPAAVEKLAELTGMPRGGPRFAVVPPPTSAEPPSRPPISAEAPSRPPLGSVEEMIGRLEARLKKNPKDAEGWRMLGWSYYGISRYEEAALAYEKAVQVNPGVAAFWSARGEALVKAGGDIVTAEAKQLFDVALRLDPKDPKARLFEGLVKAQEGNKAAALAEWKLLADEVGAESSLIPDLMQRIAALSSDARGDGIDRSRPPKPTLSGDESGLNGASKDAEAAADGDATKADSGINRP
jgi:cytochrome c-type biogenesis protein CcmH